jgi:hypothetical protein
MLYTPGRWKNALAMTPIAFWRPARDLGAARQISATSPFAFGLYPNGEPGGSGASANLLTESLLAVKKAGLKSPNFSTRERGSD